MKRAPTASRTSPSVGRASLGAGGRGRFTEPMGPRDDAFEAEADRVARAVAKGPGGGAAWSLAGGAAPRESPTIRLAPRAGSDASFEATAMPAPAEAPPEGAASGPSAAEGRGALLADDEGPLQPGQMRKGEFLDALRVALCEAVDAGLAGTGRDSQGCPWIDHWLGYYAERGASQVEQALRRYAPESRGASRAADYIGAVSARVGRSARTWATTGELTGLPQDMPASPMAGGGLLDAFGGMFFKGRPGGAQSTRPPASVQRELGPGQPLPTSVRERMEPAFGTSFAGVRLHDDGPGRRLSDEFNARAFTVGHHVAFGAGEFHPGTPAGDALIAHELAHVVQQGHAREPGPGSAARAGSLEADADRSAEAFVRKDWLGGQAPAREVAPRLRSGLSLSRCSKDKTAAPAVAQGRDLHAGAVAPDAAKLQQVQRELHPAAAAVGAALAAWDAGAAAPGTVAQKNALKADLKTKVTQAMLAELTATMPGIHAVSGTARVPIADLEGPGNAAKKVVDRHFGDWISVAALTPSQSSVRHGFAFRASGAGKNLFDANDRAQRALANLPIDAHDLAGWMAETFGADAMKPHNFSPTRGGEEQAFLETEIVTPFVNAHKPDLELFDLFGFALTDPSTGKIVIGTATSPGLGTAPGSGGAPSEAQRSLRWSAWETLVHEYIHTLEHPVFHTAGGASNRIMSEGFCTMFSEEVLLDQIPKAPKNAALRADIEGGHFPEPPAGTVPPFEAGSYAEYLKHATAIRTAVGDSAVKAAFFQGHVEFLGLTPGGATASPVVAADRDLVTVPAGIATVSELARAAHVAEADIVAANPGLSAGSPVAGTLHVPGAREHVVVEAGAGGSETQVQIARQNGITVAALTDANPAASWGSLAAGTRLLIPKR
ncbi:DUF4157 domain-containing protein [Mitsuaria sp. PDC51]|uniref:eCIS core domain-containing protein n=1 Tax=Mitsuaria sp. PDC51 TaxID=1881035 RepID=UPI000B893CFE|nr:DUF4157 domain-containing protein [Mitsuaria sp. PDC51]